LFDGHAFSVQPSHAPRCPNSLNVEKLLRSGPDFGL
jgi:hypothetical protein